MIDFNFSQFEWDEVKNSANQLKHGVSFSKAQRAFFDPFHVIIEDLKHSQEEKRYHCMGIVDSGVMTVRFMCREHVIRIIGAGYWRNGRRIYAEYQKAENRIH
ncbi:MAG: BrnT family toxin [Gammaproteobacteria bacterium]|nr:BrnT family toxin [Gammaproteobacteria bacterium]